MKRKGAVIILFSLLVITGSFYKPQASVTGAWHAKEEDREVILIYKDGYFTHTMFNKAGKKFNMSAGGTYVVKNGQLICKIEFDTQEPVNIGKEMIVNFSLTGNQLSIWGDDRQRRKLTRLDDGNGDLAGNWRITSRMNNGQMQPMQRGPRKTLKLISGTRFQWMAINPDTKEFFGTGGGTYTFTNGKYTENIEFFPRDSSRVGASLTFDGSVNGNVWTHKGMNSRGEPLHEEWARELK